MVARHHEKSGRQLTNEQAQQRLALAAVGAASFFWHGSERELAAGRHIAHRSEPGLIQGRSKVPAGRRQVAGWAACEPQHRFR